MNSKLFKTFTFLLGGMIVFSSCEDDAAVVINGDVVGTWTLSDLTGTYNRKVVTGSGIEHSADSYDLFASWDDAAGFAAALTSFGMPTDAAAITAATTQKMASWTAGENSPGFPLTSKLNTAGLAAFGVNMKGVFDDAPSEGSAATYKITGTYPSIQLNTVTCTPYQTVPQINDQGNYTLTFDATDGAGKIKLSPTTDIDQVLPPFPDGKFTVDGDAGLMTIDFIDRDNSSSRYSEVMAAWSEADDRVISGLSQLPVNTVGGFFTKPEDPGAGAVASSAYIGDPSLAPWGGYLTWYAFNIKAEASVKAADVKNPLTDLNSDGAISAVDMIMYMHADNLAGGGGESAFGLPYKLLVDSSNPAAPAVVNDSATDFTIAGLATASGGKMKFTIKSGVCIPVDETIEFKSQWTAVPE